MVQSISISFPTYAYDQLFITCFENIFLTGDSTFSQYLPHTKVKDVTPTALFQVIFQQLTADDVTEKYWKSILQFIPRAEMLHTTLNGLVKERWLEQMPDVPFPAVDFILNECTKIYGEWEIEIYQSVRSDFNGFMSGIIPISENMLVHEPFEDDINTANVMKLTHVCFVLFFFFWCQTYSMPIYLFFFLSFLQGCQN